MYVISVVFYLSTGLAGYLVDLKINCGGRKPARTLQVKKKKQKSSFHDWYSEN
jgi:hypothetical protein